LLSLTNKSVPVLYLQSRLVVIFDDHQDQISVSTQLEELKLLEYIYLSVFVTHIRLVQLNLGVSQLLHELKSVVANVLISQVVSIVGIFLQFNILRSQYRSDHTLLFDQSNITQVVQEELQLFVSTICFIYCTALSMFVAMFVAFVKNKTENIQSTNIEIYFTLELLLLNGL
jgi:hypothetical protein